MNIVIVLLVIFTLIILFVDHEQLKLAGYSIQQFNSIKLSPVPFKKRKIASEIERFSVLLLPW